MNINSAMKARQLLVQRCASSYPDNSPLFKAAVSSIKGRRDYMEDEYIIDESQAGDEFYGVFDGHAGAQVSKHIKKHLYGRYYGWRQHKYSVKDSLIKSLAEVDDEMKVFPYVGSTACIVVIERPMNSSQGKWLYFIALRSRFKLLVRILSCCQYW
jgi:hypothetical protein